MLSVTPTTLALNSVVAFSANAPQPQPISSTRSAGFARLPCSKRGALWRAGLAPCRRSWCGPVPIFKQCGRIILGVVQPQLVKRIAQVVMGMDVFLAVGFGVAVQQVFDAKQQAPSPGAVNGVFNHSAVADEDFDQVRQAGCGPVASDVGFGKTDVARFQSG